MEKKMQNAKSWKLNLEQDVDKNNCQKLNEVLNPRSSLVILSFYSGDSKSNVNKSEQKTKKILSTETFEKFFDSKEEKGSQR